MFKSYYVLSLEKSDNLYKLYHLGIRFIKVKYNKANILIYINKDDYIKIEKYLSLYNLSIYKVGGILKCRLLLKKYYIFLINIFISLIMIFILSKVIFSIKIYSNNKEIIKIINNELKDNNLLKYHFVKSFSSLEKIKNNILTNYKDKIEWLEIKRIGTKYYISVLERIKNNINKDNTGRNIVARRNATIKEIRSSSGEIIKKINDYVNKGDVIVSGNITKGDEVKRRVRAEGVVYGETWYNVKVILPHTYINKVYTGNKYDSYTLDIFNKRIYLFNGKRFVNEESVDKRIIFNKILPFTLNKSSISEIEYKTSFYTYDTALMEGMKLAKEKLLVNLDSDAKILSEKKLKLYEEDNKIVIEVFFKVYEDITDYEIINENNLN